MESEHADPQPPGQLPTFREDGRQDSTGFPRLHRPRQLERGDGGERNFQFRRQLDEGYTVEMRFNLTPMGYNVTQPNGDVVEFNISFYDCDWFWPLALKFASSRAWWQIPWGNAMWYNEVRIHAKPSVTISSGPVPPSASTSRSAN